MMLFGAEQGGARQLRISLKNEHSQNGYSFANGLYPAKRVIWYFGKQEEGKYASFNILVNNNADVARMYKFIEVVIPSFQMNMWSPSSGYFRVSTDSGEYPEKIVIEGYPYGSVSVGVKVTAFDFDGTEISSFLSGSTGAGEDLIESIIRPTQMEIESNNDVSFYEMFPDFRVIWEVADDINDYGSV